MISKGQSWRKLHLNGLLGWSPNQQSFKIREFLVPLSGLDVCMGLGLGISGQEVSFDDNNVALLTNLFNGEDITVLSIVEKLNDRKINLKKM